MGVKIILHIRHIRGHTFDVEVDRDADCIGLKLVIWDVAKIAVEAQRLVYAGKEITDETNLVNLGIDDGSTVFLVERVDNPQVNATPVVSEQVVEPQPMEVVPLREDSISVVYQPMSVNSQDSIPLEYDPAREERIHSTVDLAFWIKLYCVFGGIVSLFALVGCWGSIIPLICYILGYVGSRKLNRCCLVFPLLLSMIIGPVGFIFVLWRLATHFWPPLFAVLIVSFLHILIMMSIMKLRCRIKHLTPEEKAVAVQLSNANSKCCCC